MKRLAIAAVLAVLSGTRADAQVYYGAPTYYSPTYNAQGYYPNTSGVKYFPPTGTGYYMPQAPAFGGVNSGTGVVGVTGNLPGTVYSNGVVPANTIVPTYRYNTPAYGNPAYYNPGYYNPRYNPALYTPAYYTPGFAGS